MTIVLIVVFSSSSFAQELVPSAFPGFRHVDPTAAAPSTLPSQNVVLLADADFAPWSFVGEDGRLQGISVELAREACAVATLVCDVRALPFSELLSTVRQGSAQGIVTGLKLDAAVVGEFEITRPYFQSLGRFAVRSGSSLSAPDIRTLAGKRIGIRSNSSHARFIETFYGRSALTPFENNETMLEALRTGQVDVVFGDAVQLSYWLVGQSSRGCCSFLGKAFVHRQTFTRSLSFVVRRDAAGLRDRLDDALDRLEAKGTTATVFARYLPSTVW